MENPIKLIWDFRGPNASKTAIHHELHLKEYIRQFNNLALKTGIENINENHCIAYLIVPKIKMKLFRDALKPHRGQLVDHLN